jgi:hypothetical protein
VKCSKYPLKKGVDDQADQHNRDAQNHKQPEKEWFGVFRHSERYLIAIVDVIVGTGSIFALDMINLFYHNKTPTELNMSKKINILFVCIKEKAYSFFDPFKLIGVII